MCRLAADEPRAEFLRVSAFLSLVNAAAFSIHAALSRISDFDTFLIDFDTFLIPLLLFDYHPDSTYKGDRAPFESYFESHLDKG